MRLTALSAAFALIPALALSLAHAESIGFSVSDSASPGTSPGNMTIQVQDDVTNQPIADATITVANSLLGLEGISQSRLKTSSNGTLHLGRLATSAKTITVAKPGYTTMSIVGLQGNSVNVHLKPLHPNTPDVVVSGKFGAFQQASSSEAIQAALVFPTFGATDLLNFNYGSFVSPLKDTIEVYGSRQVPSNLVLPEQDVFLPFGSITLNKPIYRLPVTPGRAISLTGVQAEIKVNDVVPAATGGGFTVDILNSLVFTRVGLSRTMSPTADVKEDFNGSLDLVQKHQVSPETPPFNGDVIVAAATDLTGDRRTMIPTDIKTALNSDHPNDKHDVSLVGPKDNIGQSRLVLTLATSDKGTRLSGIVTGNAGRNVKPGPFLPADLIGEYTKLPDSVKVKAPSQGLGAATFHTASQLVWMVYVLPAGGEITVPTQKLAADAKIEKFTLIQLDFGNSFDERAIDGKQIMTKLERFSRVTSNETKPTPPALP